MQCNIIAKSISTSAMCFSDKNDNIDEEHDEDFGDLEDDEDQKKRDDWMANYTGDPKDRTRIIPLEKSIAYMESDAYRQTYGNHRVWELYRRNFSQGRKNAPTRKTCIRQNKISTGNPCPICRDEYLVLDYRNMKLIEQFIEDYTGQIYDTKMTGVCQTKHGEILLAIDRARDLGLLTVDQPFVEYDYSKYNR